MAFCFFTGLTAQVVNIPDLAFKTYLLSADTNNTIAKNLLGNYFKIDSNFNNKIEASEASQVSYLNLSGSTISTLEGVLSFNNLQTLNCSNNKISSLDLSNLINLKDLDCQKNVLNSISLNNLVNLQNLNCQTNYLSSINLIGLKNLQTLNCSGNNFSSLDLQGLSNLQNLDCHNNSSYISTLDLSGLVNLLQLNCSNVTMHTLIVNDLVRLQQLNCSNNSLTELNLINSIDLVMLDCSNNDLISVNVNGLTKLEDLNCSSNLLKSINVKSLIKIKNLNCRANPLTTLDLNNLNNLTNINLDFDTSLESLYLNNIGFKSNEPTHLLNFGTQFALKYICANASLMPYIQQKSTTYGYNSSGYCLVIDSSCSSDPSTDKIVNIPDAKFKTSLLNSGCIYNKLAQDLAGNFIRIDKNADGQIQVNEASQISYLVVSSSQPITSLVGILDFNNLKTLYCQNMEITSLNLSGLTNLQTVQCANNYITSLKVSGLVNLKELYCGSNKLSQLDLSGLNNLQDLDCTYNQLSSLNVGGLSNLQTIQCYSNRLSYIDFSGLISLKDLRCQSNLLTSLNVSNLTNMQYLNCVNNKLVTLDISKLPFLNSLYCSNNFLKSLFIKNGKNESNLEFSNNPSLVYICADDSQITNIASQLVVNGINKCTVNSYCSFIPGGTFYTIQGKSQLDANKNGCDATDLIFPNLKYNITSNGVTMGSIISNFSGRYVIPIQAGSYSITPMLENPSYFNVSPSILNVSFPTKASPFIQDFCVTPNGVHPDLEVALLPIDRARPGFDSSYKIIYKNKGNTTQSGSVNLSFNDSVLDFITANPAVTAQTTNNVSWNFTNLKPFESREITVTIKVNAPTATPAVNNGDILSYTVTITSANTDETPKDNSFSLNQTVVGSYDPNDKTCLEGTVITPTLIGEYVHYMIRFENTGTYAAKNIVVKDMIDLSKFDISTLTPTSSSHSFVTKISEGNKVEFIFENVNLPFDDANNDGYIAFKIKTKPTLVVGDSFTNEVNIYFDYNFPILTNKAISTFKTLGTSDFEFSNYVSLYPNPANSILNISSKNTIEIQLISVYDVLGRLVITIPNAQKISAIDVSELKSGSYFVKINSDKGISNTKFIKN